VKIWVVAKCSRAAAEAEGEQTAGAGRALEKAAPPEE